MAGRLRHSCMSRAGSPQRKVYVRSMTCMVVACASAKRQRDSRIEPRRSVFLFGSRLEVKRGSNPTFA